MIVKYGEGVGDVVQFGVFGVFEGSGIGGFKFVLCDELLDGGFGVVYKLGVFQIVFQVLLKVVDVRDEEVVFKVGFYIYIVVVVGFVYVGVEFVCQVICEEVVVISGGVVEGEFQVFLVYIVVVVLL